MPGGVIPGNVGFSFYAEGLKNLLSNSTRRHIFQDQLPDKARQMPPSGRVGVCNSSFKTIAIKILSPKNKRGIVANKTLPMQKPGEGHLGTCLLNIDKMNSQSAAIFE